jgi:type II secretory pathway pseudopilin PulG
MKSNFKLKIKNYNLTSGFTLIELLLYITIVSFMVVTLIPLAWNVIEGQAKVAVEEEVYANGRNVSQRIKQEIRNATGINSVTATSISLAVSDGSKNPTIIDLSGGKVRIKWGAATAVNLNSDDTVVSGLTFTDYTSVDNKTKHIGFVFTISDNLSATRQEYQESVAFRSSAEMRSN